MGSVHGVLVYKLLSLFWLVNWFIGCVLVNGWIFGFVNLVVSYWNIRTRMR